MQRRCMIGVMAAGVLSVSAGASAGWQDLLKSATDSLTGVGDSSQLSSLTNAEMNAGLKDALAVGVERAINGLGRSSGAWTTPAR